MIPTTAISAPAADVGDLSRGLNRWAVRLAGQPQQTVQAQVVHVVAGAIAVRAVLAVAGDRAVDERGLSARSRS